jgi:hypothetical protein
MERKKAGLAIGLAVMLAFSLGVWMGQANAERQAREAWLSQPAYEWYEVVGSWDIYNVGVDNESIYIVWYNRTAWGVAVFERGDPSLVIEFGEGGDYDEWFVFQYREYYTRLNSGVDVYDGDKWALVV